MEISGIIGKQIRIEHRGSSVQVHSTRIQKAPDDKVCDTNDIQTGECNRVYRSTRLGPKKHQMTRFVTQMTFKQVSAIVTPVKTFRVSAQNLVLPSVQTLMFNRTCKIVHLRQ
ncbi:unnamed protein product [Meganyctiphanes norvegica]|uniref:Uncharacterized protein n=1 Tax=Meganyctiphanes norvegica TaxID=48144 RepID=A0AAV2R4M1_MEGNR